MSSDVRLPVWMAGTLCTIGLTIGGYFLADISSSLKTITKDVSTLTTAAAQADVRLRNVEERLARTEATLSGNADRMQQIVDREVERVRAQIAENETRARNWMQNLRGDVDALQRGQDVPAPRRRTDAAPPVMPGDRRRLVV